MTVVLICGGLLSLFSSSADTVKGLPAAVPEIDLPDEEEIASMGGGTEYLEDLEWLEDHPLDLNRAGIEDLTALPGISSEDAATIVQYRKDQGPFRSVAGLRLIPNAGEDLFRLLSPYVRVISSSSARVSGPTLRLRSTTRLPADEAAAGSPHSAYARAEISPYPGWEAGVSAEKDPGEPASHGFAGGYLRGTVGGLSIIVGDYGVESGEGLVVRTNYGPGRSLAGAGTSGRLARGIIAHRSTEELRFLRGAACSWRDRLDDPSLQVDLFVSRRALPATVDSTGTAGNLGESGSFTTPSAIANSAAERETVVGMRLVCTPGGGFTVGGAGFVSRYDTPLDHDDPLRSHAARWNAGGINIAYDAGFFRAFAELAGSGIGRAEFAGIAPSFGRGLKLLLTWRRSSPSYDNPHAMAFGGRTRNESGSYAGFEWRPLPWVQVRGYADVFHGIAPTRTVQFPGDGREEALSGEVDIGRTSSLILEYRTAISTGSVRETGAEGWEVHVPSTGVRDSWKCAMRCGRDRGLSFLVRCAGVSLHDESGQASKGFGLTQEISGRVFPGVTFKTGIALYRTGGYGPRLYVLDAPLPGSTSLLALYGQGRFWYIHASVSLSRAIVIHAAVSCVERSGGADGDAGGREYPSSNAWRGGLQVDFNPD